jgi:hypothetical protein
VTAKEIVVKPISSQDAARIVKACHYSGKVVQNSQLHFGVFLDGKCGGAMQFGPSLDKRKMLGLVSGTGWNGFIELNRMAFADWLPRNSESRAIAVAMRLIRKSYPHIEWVVSFADGTQCGDGTIYRASGFVLTSVAQNSSMWQHVETGEKRQDMQFFHTGTLAERKSGKWRKIPGFMLRYLYFLNPAARARLTVPILPFSEIDKRGAGMYKGKQRIQSRAGGDTTDTPVFQTGEGGSTPTPALQSSE